MPETSDQQLSNQTEPSEEDKIATDTQKIILDTTSIPKGTSPLSNGETIEDTMTFLDKMYKLKKEGHHAKFADQMENWIFLRTGIPSFDLNYGGIPLGKYIVGYGPQGAGKTTWVARMIAQAQRRGLRVALAPTEGVFDKLYFQMQGVDLSRLLILGDPRLGATGQMIVDLAENNKIDIAAIDSLTMLLPEEIKAKKVEEDDMAVDARRITRWLKKLTPAMVANNVTTLMICQVRHQIGGGGAPTGPPLEVYNGGNAVKHESALTIKFRRTAKSYLRAKGVFMKELGLISYSAICEKSKSILIREGNGQSKEAAYTFFTDSGMDKERTLFEHAYRHGVLTQAGAHYRFIPVSTPDPVSVAGELNFVNMLRTEPDKYDALFNTCWVNRIRIVSERTGLSPENILGSMSIL